MRPADVLGRGSVRLALAFAVLLIAAFALAGTVAWSLIREELRDHEDQRLRQAWDALAVEASDGPAELAASVEEQLAALSDRSTVILLTDAAGRRLAGNVPALTVPGGWSDLPGAVLAGTAEGDYRVYSGPIGSTRLLVASDDANLREVGEIVLGALGWASVAALIGALAGGAALAAGVQARIERIEAALDRVGQGDLAARVGARGTGDLARIGAGIDAALGRLEGLVEGMRQVSTDIAHDLRTPLARLRQQIEASAALAPEGSDLIDKLDDALMEVDGLDATFAALLRIAQIEAGARRDRFAPLDLGEVLGRLVEAYEGVAEEAGQSLDLACDAVTPVLGDRDLLTQLFANLIENAIRHGPPGIRIACAVTHDAGRTIAIVQDTGPGIPEAERDLVLRRLYRQEKSRTSAGTGLGLALVKAVADLHGAELKLSDGEPGLRVTLSFPPMRNA